MSTQISDKPRLSAPGLWAKLQAVHIAGAHELAFHYRLAIKLELSEDDAREVELMYRRFLYLQALTSQRLDAPPLIQAAWAMHARTPGYEAFCARHLGTPLAYRFPPPGRYHDEAVHAMKIEYVLEFGESLPDSVETTSEYDNSDYHLIAQNAGLWLFFAAIGGLLYGVLPAEWKWLAMTLGMIGIAGFVIKFSEVLSSDRSKREALREWWVNVSPW